MRKYFIPGWVGRGLDLDLRIRPAAPAASGNPGYTDLVPSGLRSKNKVSERHGLQPVKRFREKNLKSGSSLLTFRDPSSHICEINLWMAEHGNLDPGKTGFVQTPFCCGFLKKWDPDMFPKSQISKISCSSHSKNLILS